ncbi:MAG: LysR substrate-binding domain-containing protein [Oxalobacteraceae bacterium]|jgi:DNA-binding transcriptional LysR family regulator|nr:LysR substrate-binding domain-containing protein [Oxalobacteraceae bacterium]
MDIEWLEDFLVLSDLSSFTRAAQSRNVTQSAFSRRIRSLEDWIGIPLIDRDTVPPRLTVAGHLFRDAAREMVRQLQDTRIALGHKTRAFSGVKLFISHSLIDHFLPEWIQHLNRRITGLKLDITAGETYDGMVALSNGRCDLLMVYYSSIAPMTIDEKACASIVLAHDRLIPVCVPNTEGEPTFSLSMFESSAIPIVLYPPETFFGRIVNGIVRFGPRTPHFSVVAQSANSRVLRGLALNGSGVAWLPERCVREDLHHGTLVHAGGEQWNSNIEIRLYASPERAKLLEFNLWENIRDWQEASLATT